MEGVRLKSAGKSSVLRDNYQFKAGRDDMLAAQERITFRINEAL